MLGRTRSPAIQEGLDMLDQVLVDEVNAQNDADKYAPRQHREEARIFESTPKVFHLSFDDTTLKLAAVITTQQQSIRIQGILANLTPFLKDDLTEPPDDKEQT